MTEERYWRYDDSSYEDSEPFLQAFKVVRRTPKGLFLDVYGREKFQLSGEDGKRFAYSTVELAKRSYIKRKNRAILLLKAQLHKQENMLHFAETGNMPDKEFTFE